MFRELIILWFVVGGSLDLFLVGVLVVMAFYGHCKLSHAMIYGVCVGGVIFFSFFLVYFSRVGMSIGEGFI